MSTKTRRLPREGPRLSALSNLRRVSEAQELFNRELLEIINGVPTGFYEQLPQVIEGGAAASAGAEGDGWSAGRHRHALNTTGVPGDATGTISAQGAGPGVSLSGHTHRGFDPVTDPFILAIRG
jgi:hypothetical protein